MRRRAILLLALLAFASPIDAAPRRRAVVAPSGLGLSFDFQFGALGWEAGFSDYSPASGDMRLEAKIAPLPPELGTGQGFYISGMNRSDDLFMFLRRRLGPADGIQPNRAYLVTFTVRLGSDAPAGCVGAGGAPGESVYLKVGASPRMPMPQLDGTNHYVMNIDKGHQGESGADASVAGNIANGRDCDGSYVYVSIVRKHRHTSVVRSSPEGDLWLLVGTDSAYEGLTSLYYQRIDVTLTPAD
ncbi:MAG TPA: hypothetical protein VNL91_10100 [Thermoanaerobaculia bacterium]|nr:hypothetical protein [Thermoanaerobaculia bacterium]